MRGPIGNLRHEKLLLFYVLSQQVFQLTQGCLIVSQPFDKCLNASELRTE